MDGQKEAPVKKYVIFEVPKVKFLKNPQFRGAKLPFYATPGSSGMDVFAAEDLRCEIHKTVAINTGWILADITPNWELQVRSRSGYALSLNVNVKNQPGTVDNDYRGEIKVLLTHSGPESYKDFTKGQKIAQIVVAPVVQAEIEEVKEATEATTTKRGSGGFGSTGM